MEDKKINEVTSWGDIAEYQAAWKKFKAEKGDEAADAMEFIDAWCKEHPDMDNEDDRNGMFADISAMEESLKEELNDNDHDDFTHKLYGAIRSVVEEFMNKGLTDTDLVTALEFVEIHLGDEFDFAESLRKAHAEDKIEEAKEEEPKLETFEDKINFLIGDEDEAIAGYDKIIAMLGEDDANAIEQLTHLKEEEVAHKDFLEVLKGDKEAVYEHADEEKKDEIDVDAEMEVVDIDDIDDDFGVGESLEEDTVKKGNKWVNKGKEGTHGEFKTKKEADAQRKAMFANGYHEEVEEDIDDDFGSGNFIAEEAEEFGVTVNWDDMEDGVDEEDAKTFKKVIKNTDDKILDKHFGKDTPERKLVGAIKDMDEEAHETGHIKAKKPIELRARR